jgi:hypothetical protein
MEDGQLKKTVRVGDTEVTLFSIDGGASWGSNLEELQRHQKQREKRVDEIIAQARRIFPKNYLNNL